MAHAYINEDYQECDKLTHDEEVRTYQRMPMMMM